VTSTADARGSLSGLAARLTEAQDRETYAALVSYFDSLPPGDELFRLAQLLGLLSLLGQRVPEAAAELLAELREQTEAAGDYHAQVDGRLARLPQEIAQGVDAGAIAKAMSESFRQQLAATGLQETATLLNLSAKEIKTLAANIASALKPVTQEYKGVSSAELGKLTAASRQLQEHNARLIVQERANALVRQGLLALVLFLVGGLCGIVLEKRQTTDVLSAFGSQIEQIQTSPAPLVPPAKRRRCIPARP
jgi:hypothetical protein